MILRPGQAGVGVRAAELELAGRVGQHLVAVAGELGGHQRGDHVVAQVRQQQRLEVDVRVVLGGDQHGLQPDRAAVLVLEGHLGLAVGAQVGQHARPCAPGPGAGPAGGPARSASA